MTRTTGPAGGAWEALRAVVERMPDPAGNQETTALEHELATAFDTRHAIAVSSGTAALHTALAASGVGAGDEVLVPAATVVMTVAAVVAAGAHPVFVETRPGEPFGMDITDAAAKITPATAAILPVHLAGRTTGIHHVAGFATRTGLTLIEDACQAQGSRDRERHAGTLGDVGCFSLKDGKLLASGEGGYLLTDRDDIAARAAAFRSHWHTGAPGAPVGSRLAYNFRLAEPLAALARHHLTDFDAALARRRAQTHRLYELVGDSPGLVRIEPGPAERPNDYSPVWRIDHLRPRGFAEHLARRGVLNSVGTFGLRAAPTHPACQTLNPAPCPNAAGAVDRLLAVVVHADTTPAALERMAATIRKEAAEWATTA